MSLFDLQKDLIAKTRGARPSPAQKDAAEGISAEQIKAGIAEAEEFLYNAKGVPQELKGKLVADGVVSAQEKEIIRKFQKDHGLNPTGELRDLRTVSAIITERAEDAEFARQEKQNEQNASTAVRALVQKGIDEVRRDIATAQGTSRQTYSPAEIENIKRAEQEASDRAVAAERQQREQERLNRERQARHAEAQQKAEREQNRVTNFVTASAGKEYSERRLAETYIALSAHEQALKRYYEAGGKGPVTVTGKDLEKAKKEFVEAFKDVPLSERKSALEAKGAELLSRMRLSASERAYKKDFSAAERDQISGSPLSDNERLAYQRTVDALTSENRLIAFAKRVFGNDGNPLRELEKKEKGKPAAVRPAGSGAQSNTVQQGSAATGSIPNTSSQNRPAPEIQTFKFEGASFKGTEAEIREAKKILKPFGGIGAEIFKDVNNYAYTVEQKDGKAVFKFYANKYKKNGEEPKLVATREIPLDLKDKSAAPALRSLIDGLKKDGEIRAALRQAQAEVEQASRPVSHKFYGAKFVAKDSAQLEQAKKLLNDVGSNIGGNTFRFSVEEKDGKAVLKFYANTKPQKGEREILVDKREIPLDLRDGKGLEALSTLVADLKRDGALRNKLDHAKLMVEDQRKLQAQRAAQPTAPAAPTQTQSAPQASAPAAPAPRTAQPTAPAMPTRQRAPQAPVPAAPKPQAAAQQTAAPAPAPKPDTTVQFKHKNQTVQFSVTAAQQDDVKRLLKEIDKSDIPYSFKTEQGKVVISFQNKHDKKEVAQRTLPLDLKSDKELKALRDIVSELKPEGTIHKDAVKKEEKEKKEEKKDGPGFFRRMGDTVSGGAVSAVERARQAASKAEEAAYQATDGGSITIKGKSKEFKDFNQAIKELPAGITAKYDLQKKGFVLYSGQTAIPGSEIPISREEIDGKQAPQALKRAHDRLVEIRSTPDFSRAAAEKRTAAAAQPLEIPRAGGGAALVLDAAKSPLAARLLKAQEKGFKYEYDASAGTISIFKRSGVVRTDVGSVSVNSPDLQALETLLSK